MDNFLNSGIYSKQAHVDIPEGLFEEEHGRKGFFGRVSQLYLTEPPTDWTSIDGELKPMQVPPVYQLDLGPNTYQPILENNDVVISIANITESGDYFFRNADYDELLFIHQGTGSIETIYGPLEYQTGDYIVIPRGTTYKTYPNSDSKVLKVESGSEFEEPDRGMLGPNALFDQSMKVVPEAKVGSEQNLKEYKLQIKRLGKMTTVTYPFNPLNAKGWSGSLYPYKLSIYDICPIMSHRYHIPPSGHTTFVAHNFVVCSFVERPLEDTKHKVLKVPFYHSNIDFDEVIFYHQGNFFSRDNIDAGAITFHPQGIHHGPHPKAYENRDKNDYTDEYAVMIDTRYPLSPTKWFEQNQNRDYWKSWQS